MLKEYLRPWKLVTFALGLSLLIAGALYYNAPDWDIGISLIMGMLTYIIAPWVFHIATSYQYKLFPFALFAYWFTVDGSYTAYNNYMGHPINMDLRLANLFASSLLFILCGWFWSPKLSLREFLMELATTLHKSKKQGR